MRRVPGLKGYVWWCGDDYCDCTEARIGRWAYSRSGYLVLHEVVWSGEFHTDGETGATTELNRTAQAMRRHCHDLYAQIEWPWDVSSPTPS